jgi:antagonist of KipI
MRVVNALVGNEDGAAGLEATLGTVRLRFEDERLVAWCGGDFTVEIGDRINLPPGHAGLVSAGDELVMAAPKTGSRVWLAISGGIDVVPVLGSRSTDLRAGFGGYEGRTLRDGDYMPLGSSSLSSERIERMFGEERIASWAAPSAWVTTARGRAFLRIMRGEHWSRFASNAQLSFLETAFTVTADSDRMGVRLDGLDLERTDAAELLSEAVAPGTIQVPPNGKPILLLGDCQTIGGYPRIAHVITVDLSNAAQLWPGDQVRFYEVSLGEAQELLCEREKDFAWFRAGISLRWK